MRYQDKEIDVISTRTLFGKKIAEIKILSSREILSVLDSEWSDEKKASTNAEITFKAIPGFSAQMDQNQVTSESFKVGYFCLHCTGKGRLN